MSGRWAPGKNPGWARAALHQEGRVSILEELLTKGEVVDLCEPKFVHYTAPDGTQVRAADYWSNHDNQCLSLDHTPPVTTASTVPPAADWVNTDVVVTLAATDSGPLATGVKEVIFSASGAQLIAETHVAGANASLTISSEGFTTVSFHAVDTMGNAEPTQTLLVRIDKTPPLVRYTGNLGTYTVDQTIDITCSATDALSGIRSTTCADIHRPAFELPLGPNTFSASAVDLAGNSASASVTFRPTRPSSPSWARADRASPTRTRAAPSSRQRPTTAPR